MRTFRLLSQITKIVISFFLGKKKFFKYRTNDDPTFDEVMDVISDDKKGPCCAIEANPDIDSSEGFVILPDEGDGWVDVEVKHLSEETIRLVLARINNVDVSAIEFTIPKIDHVQIGDGWYKLAA